MDRPKLEKGLAAETFREYYYLKEELVAFCRENGLPVSGGKAELAERTALFLETGKALNSPVNRRNRSAASSSEITADSVIEADIVCSEKLRAFFKKEIGKTFSFNVAFQKWLKSNAGKTYGDAVAAYYEILKAKKTSKTTIDPQFEYNAYIRDFFADNAGRSLAEAIKCWKWKKSQKGSNKYERSDLAALEA